MEAIGTVPHTFNRLGGGSLGGDALGRQSEEAEKRATDSKSYPVSSLISSKHCTVKSVVQRFDDSTEAGSEARRCKSLSHDLSS